MDYIYDIILNFHENYYDFYEWKKEDKIINIKKIPIYKITNKDYLMLKNNDITIERECLPKSNKIFLITSGFEVMGLLIDNNGRILKKSGLLFEESDDILEDKDSIKFINLKYKINKINKLTYQSRKTLEKSKYIESYFNSIDKNQDEYLLKYLYYDIYHVEEKNLEKIYQELQTLKKEDINKMYESIKRVNLELKR